MSECEKKYQNEYVIHISESAQKRNYSLFYETNCHTELYFFLRIIYE
jgi:hypothetical protein